MGTCTYTIANYTDTHTTSRYTYSHSCRCLSRRFMCFLYFSHQFLSFFAWLTCLSQRVIISQLIVFVLKRKALCWISSCVPYQGLILDLMILNSTFSRNQQYCILVSHIEGHTMHCSLPFPALCYCHINMLPPFTRLWDVLHHWGQWTHTGHCHWLGW